MNGGALLAASWLLGYLLPGPMILRRAAERRSELLPSTFEVVGTLRLRDPGGGKSAGEQEIRAKLSFSPGRCRWQFEGEKPFEVTNDRGRIDPGEPRWAIWLAKLGCEPFLSHGSPTGILDQELRAGGDDIDEVALTRLFGEVAYVLGAGEAGAGKTGLVVAKRSLMPLRFWMDQQGVRVGCDFRRYEATFHAGGFPRQIDLAAGDTVVASFVSKSE
jgi:hypothetical protein